MLGHFIVNAQYKGNLYRVSEHFRNANGQITHVNIFPVAGAAKDIKAIRVPVNDVELHQVA